MIRDFFLLQRKGDLDFPPFVEPELIADKKLGIPRLIEEFFGFQLMKDLFDILFTDLPFGQLFADILPAFFLLAAEVFGPKECLFGVILIDYTSPCH